jgi:hypothetical protein
VTALYTASWRALWEASKAGPLPVQPVRVSRGRPKFWLAAFPAVEELMPPGWMFNSTDREKNERGYRHQLDRIGLERISARLDEIAAEHDGAPLALACFETDRGGCHRSWAASWLCEQTGVAVPELSVLRGREGAVQLVFEVEPPERSGQNTCIDTSGRQLQLATAAGAAEGQ